ncbi:type I polyketide synthase [Saccharopolyspora taberi]|uniref:Carrier domain-containing protein n=1 Tax=Saccharopolyspora taberi TaxID=60895 RepID=A0ABN3V3P6_9PSEU
MSEHDEFDDAAIAVVGMACRFPGARDVDEYWSNLVNGVDSVTRYAEQPVAGGRDSYIPARGLLADPEWFDAGYFGLSLREARLISPQHRVFLECAAEALEDAGCDAPRYPGLIGVYGGGSETGYGHVVRSRRDGLSGVTDWEILLGSAQDFMLSRVAYKLGLTGPAINVQAACATALVAVHTAVQALLSGDCDLALAGAASVHYPEKQTPYSEGGIIAKDGTCRAFDHRGSGTVGGDGAGIVVLKRLSDALADNDTVHAVVRGTAVNNDGSHRAGFTAPGVDGQAAVIRAAHQVSQVDAGSIGYVEAHGTATPLGDPIEIEALTKAFRKDTDRTGYCRIGSVKTNIGHTDAAAGIAGFIKAALALKHRVLPPSLHFEKPNPHIDFDSSPFRVVAQRQDWDSEGPRRAGVSSFGIGGTNAHVVLEEAPQPDSAPAGGEFHLLPISARTPTALDAITSRLAEHLRATPELPIADVAWTLQTGRQELPWRRCALVRDREDALAVLSDASRLPSSSGPVSASPVIFAFTGRIPELGDLAHLHREEPEFRRTFDEIAAAANGDALTERTPPGALIALADGVGRARVLAARGVVPTAVTAYGTGALAAAVVSGALKLTDAISLAERHGDFEAALAEPSTEVLQAPDTEPISAEEAQDPATWAAFARREAPDGWASDRCVVEIGPGEHFPESALARTWIAGGRVRWKPDGVRRRVPLPTYPFERERHIVEAPRSVENPQPVEADPPPEAPPEPLEDVVTTVTRVFGETLGVPGYEADQDFFELGGDSLIAADLLARLREIYRVELDPLVIFDASTPALLARLLDQPASRQESS